MTENPNFKFWIGEAPKMEGNSVENFANDIFFYKIPANPCVIKLGNLIKIGAGAAADFFILEFGNKSTEGDSVASDIEFDSITLTLSQKSINERIRTQRLESVTQESGQQIVEEKKSLDEEKKKLLELMEADTELTNDEKNAAISEITGLESIEGLKNLSNSTIRLPAAVVSDVSSFINKLLPSFPGGSKRSMMSSFSRQFELPMPCHAKKRRSRSKKSRGGRRKKGKHSRKHHK